MRVGLDHWGAWRCITLSAAEVEGEFLHEEEEEGEQHANSQDDQGGEGVLEAQGQDAVRHARCFALHPLHLPIQQTPLQDAYESGEGGRRGMRGVNLSISPTNPYHY